LSSTQWGVCVVDGLQVDRNLRLRALSTARSALALHQVRRYGHFNSKDLELISLVEPSASDHQSSDPRARRRPKGLGHRSQS
jgi:hypothetical protein